MCIRDSYTDSDSTGDIHKFTSGLADACVRLGVACRYGAEVTALAREHGKVRVAMSEDSSLFDAVVICAGTASRAMAASLGDHVNVYPVKGYSITVQLDDAASRAAAPKVSLLDDATKLVSSRLGEDRLRVGARRNSMASTTTSAPTASARCCNGSKSAFLA